MPPFKPQARVGVLNLGTEVVGQDREHGLRTRSPRERDAELRWGALSQSFTWGGCSLALAPGRASKPWSPLGWGPFCYSSQVPLTAPEFVLRRRLLQDGWGLVTDDPGWLGLPELRGWRLS